MLAIEIIKALKKPEAKFTPDFFEFHDGTIVWNASLVLQHYLTEKHNSLRGKRVLELGSGLGHAAFGLARMGAHVTCTERPKCLPELQASLEQQIAECKQNGHAMLGSIQAAELEWGEEAFHRSPLAAEGVPPFDAIILAELVYNTLYHDVLLWTLQRFTHPSTVRQVIYSVLLDRPFSFAFFSALAGTGQFDVQAITDYDTLGMDPELLCMHIITPIPEATSQQRGVEEPAGDGAKPKAVIST